MKYEDGITREGYKARFIDCLNEINKVKQERDELKKDLSNKEAIIKEAREWMNDNCDGTYRGFDNANFVYSAKPIELISILNKADDPHE